MKNDPPSLVVLELQSPEERAAGLAEDLDRERAAHAKADARLRRLEAERAGLVLDAERAKRSAMAALDRYNGGATQ